MVVMETQLQEVGLQVASDKVYLFEELGSLLAILFEPRAIIHNEGRIQVFTRNT